MTSGHQQSPVVILEEKAAEALKFYTANYDALVWQGLQPELSLNLGDGRGQAAAA